MAVEQAKPVEQCGNDDDNYCPGFTTERILKQHGVSHELALEIFINTLWSDHYHFEDALRDKRRRGENTGGVENSGRGNSGGVPPRALIEQVLDALDEQIMECSMDIVDVVKGEPIMDDGSVAEGYKAQMALREALEAAIADTRNEFAAMTAPPHPQ